MYFCFRFVIILNGKQIYSIIIQIIMRIRRIFLSKFIGHESNKTYEIYTHLMTKGFDKI